MTVRFLLQENTIHNVTSVAAPIHSTSVMAGRMIIEQPLRNDKSKRNGWSPHDTKITEPRRLYRLPLIMAIAKSMSVRPELSRPSGSCQN